MQLVENGQQSKTTLFTTVERLRDGAEDNLPQKRQALKRVIPWIGGSVAYEMMRFETETEDLAVTGGAGKNSKRTVQCMNRNVLRRWWGVSFKAGDFCSAVVSLPSAGRSSVLRGSFV